MAKRVKKKEGVIKSYRHEKDTHKNAVHVGLRIINQLNNIFNQYHVEENRLTNSFLQTLAQNDDLLKTFLRNFNIPLKQNSQIIISCQKEPFSTGDEIESEKIESIPDGWLIIDENTAVVFETKISVNSVRLKQIESHIRKIRSYENKFLCLITPDTQPPIKETIINDATVNWFSWRQIYGLVTQFTSTTNGAGSFLIKALKEFLLMKDDLVGFQGINFADEQYNTHEAKTILKNLIEEIKPDVLKKYPLLTSGRKSLGEDFHAYTVYHRSMWACLGVEGYFTQDIHITLWLNETHLGIGMTIPNKATDRWKRLRAVFGNDNFFEEFKDKLFILRNKSPNLYLEFVQRHYLQQRNGIIDGILEVDVDTTKSISKSKVKPNPLWLKALREIIRNKNNYNGQLMIRTRFFYKDHLEDLKRADFKNTVLKTVNDFNELYSFLMVK